MTLHCLASINRDHVYRLPRMPEPGETLPAPDHASGLGGKGANQALSAAAAGARVHLVGALGRDGADTRAALAAAGVDTAGIATVEAATGHAVVFVEPTGENRILVHGGANRAIPEGTVEAALARARPGDWWLAQNETNRVAESLAAARAAGLRTAYAAAPFEAEAAAEALPHADLLALNAGEAEALACALGVAADALPVPSVLVTRGAAGATWRDRDGTLEIPAHTVEPVDTTGAGDVFLGWTLGLLDLGREVRVALTEAAAAAALSVTRPGAAASIPTAAEVRRFAEGRQ